MLQEYDYRHEDSTLLSNIDLYKIFNNYRVNKYIIGILLALKKTHLSEYKVLEAGGGNGDKTRMFTELRVKPKNCYGIDINEKAISLCQELSPSSMNFQVGSVLDMPYENKQFDIVLCSGLFSAVGGEPNIKKTSEEISRVMADDGVMFVIDINENFHNIYGTNKAVLDKNFTHFNSQNGELESLLKKEFKNVHHMHIFSADSYRVGEQAADVSKLSFIDSELDKGFEGSAYSMWVFNKR